MNKYIEVTLIFKNGLISKYNTSLTSEAEKLSNDEVLKGYNKQYGETFNTIFKEGINGYFDFSTEDNSHVHIQMSEVVSVEYKVVNY